MAREGERRVGAERRGKSEGSPLSENTENHSQKSAGRMTATLARKRSRLCGNQNLPGSPRKLQVDLYNQKKLRQIAAQRGCSVPITESYGR